MYESRRFTQYWEKWQFQGCVIILERNSVRQVKLQFYACTSYRKCSSIICTQYCPLYGHAAPRNSNIINHLCTIIIVENRYDKPILIALPPKSLTFGLSHLPLFILKVNFWHNRLRNDFFWEYLIRKTTFIYNSVNSKFWRNLFSKIFVAKLLNLSDRWKK